ncbi:hypothetical protein GGR57DRAFT_492502 [Xylariaceae sp. FL1272]|nr:hypothetical protein GGR57DRAFT_492502 [Xylariaceae sp. FL1272]
MSGFEIAGIVLGAIPLVISAIEHIQANKGTVGALLHHRHGLIKLLRKLRNQRIYFYYSMRELILETGIDNNPDLEEEDCFLILQDKHTEATLRGRLGHHYPVFLDVLEQYQKYLMTIAKKLKNLRWPDGAYKDDLRVLVEANRPTNGSKFEFRNRLKFSIDRGVLNELVDALGEEHLTLEAIVKGMKTQQAHTSKDPSPEATRISTFLTQVSTYARSLFTAACQTCTCSCKNNHTVFLGLQSRIPPPKAKRFEKNVEQGSMGFEIVFDLNGHFQPAHVKASLAHDMETQTITRTKRQVSFQNIDEVPVVVVTIAGPLSESAISTKTMGICDLVNDGSKHGLTLGLRLSGTCFELAHELSQPQPEPLTPTSLAQVLQQMTLKQQTLCALDIASRTMKFIPAAGCKPSRNPILFVAQVTEPSRANNLVQDAKLTILELAIILLEIWHRVTLEQWVDPVSSAKILDTLDRRREAEKWLEWSSDRVAPEYISVVEQCLQMCAGRKFQWDDDGFLKKYCENVVLPLRKLCEAWDGPSY